MLGSSGKTSSALKQGKTMYLVPKKIVSRIQPTTNLGVLDRSPSDDENVHEDDDTEEADQRPPSKRGVLSHSASALKD